MRKDNSQVLITGGAGFIGRHLAAAFVAEGRGVRVLDNLSRCQVADLHRLAPSAQLINGDVRDPAAVAAAVSGCDAVFHLAAVSSVADAESNPGLAFDVNVTGTFNVVRAARDHGVSRILLASSREVYGRPQSLPVPESAPLLPHNVYGASKAAAEVAARVAGSPADVIVVRIANVYGAGDRGRVIPVFIDRALRDEPLVVYDGSQTLDFVSVSRVVQVLARIGNYAKCVGPFNIGSGQGLTIAALARQVIRLTGSCSKIQLEPARCFEVDRFVADVERISRSTGYQRPEDPLDALPSTIAGHRTDARNGLLAFRVLLRG